MEMNLENLELESLQDQLDKDGYIILKNFFDKEFILHLKNLAQEIFRIQFDHFGYNDTFENNMIRLFNEQEEVFKNCGKLIQTGLIPLYQLASDNQLLNQVMELGLQYPNMCTRPVLFFNHPQLAKEEVYYKTPPHQDWSSMESSMDSVVVWVPLVDVNKENGSIIIYPNTHKLGILPFKISGGFTTVETVGEEIQTELEIGDIVIFSTLLIHESGDILNNTIRWSCHYRYTNMLDSDFIERGFPNPYIYKPITK